MTFCQPLARPEHKSKVQRRKMLGIVDQFEQPITRRKKLLESQVKSKNVRIEQAQHKLTKVQFELTWQPPSNSYVVSLA